MPSDRLQLGHGQREPFDAVRRLEADLDAGIVAIAFDARDHAFTKARMTQRLADVVAAVAPGAGLAAGVTAAMADLRPFSLEIDQ